MKKLFLFSIFTVFSFFIVSCDDSSGGTNTVKPSPETSKIVASGVYYDADNQELYSEITVTVNDTDGNALLNRYVTLKSFSANTSFDATELQSDENGEVVFKAISHVVEDATIIAYLSNSSGIDVETATQLDATTIISFKVDLVLTSSNPVYTFENGTFTITAGLTDAQGAVENAQIMVGDATDISFDSTSLTTDSSGEADFEAVTSMSKSHEVPLTLAGITPDFLVSVDLFGPEIGGNIDVGMSDPWFSNPRVGLIAMDISDGGGIMGVLDAGTNLSDLPDPSVYSLNLPIIPPEEFMIRDNDNAMDVGVFILFSYNDVNGDNEWQPGEAISGSKMHDGVVIFIRPDDPQSEYSGWMLLDELSDNPNFLDWDTQSHNLDFTILSAPVKYPHISGSVADSNFDNKRISWFVVDGPALQTSIAQGHFFEVINTPSQNEVIFDSEIDSTGSFDGTALDISDVLDEITIEAWKLPMDIGGRTLHQLFVIPVYYEDIDLSGDYNQGDLILGLSRPPVGGAWNISYVLDMPPIFAIYLSGNFWLHNGYNWWASPVEKDITAIVPDNSNYRITLENNLPNGWVDVDFEIYAAGTSTEDSTPVATGTFDTTPTPDVLTTTCTGCENVVAGDRIKIIENYDETTFIDWSELFNMGPFMN